MFGFLSPYVEHFSDVSENYVAEFRESIHCVPLRVLQVMLQTHVRRFVLALWCILFKMNLASFDVNHRLHTPKKAVLNVIP